MLVKLSPIATMLAVQHTHDCDNCVFLGHVGFPARRSEKKQDVWFCSDGRTLILRNGPDGEYACFQLSQDWSGFPPYHPLHDAMSLLQDYETAEYQPIVADITPLDQKEREVPVEYRVQSRIGEDRYSGPSFELFSDALALSKQLHKMGLPARVQTPIGWDHEELVWQDVNN